MSTACTASDGGRDGAVVGYGSEGDATADGQASMRVLYATDGGDAAVAAGRLIETVADRERVQITVASVVPTGVPGLRNVGTALRSHDARRRAADEAVQAARYTLDAAGFDTDGLVREGSPAATLTEMVVAQDAELVVAGSGVRWIGGRLLGSVSTDLVHCASTAVLIVHDAPRRGSVTVVAGVDGSDHAERALDLAMAFLDPQHCSVIIVCTAELMAPTLGPPYVAHATSAPSPEVEAEVTNPAREHADRAVQRLGDNGFDVRSRVMLGHPVRRLLSEIDDVGADLAVVGSRGLDALDRAALGSVSDQVVRFAPATLIGR